MIFIKSLIFFIISVIISYIYYIPIIIILVAIGSYLNFKINIYDSIKSILKINFKIVITVFILHTILMTSIYTKGRILYIGQENKYLNAKEYFVSGQSLYFFRKFITNFVHPESSILSPLNNLQKKIYEQGIKYLPENDGESWVWFNKWFLYFYTSKLITPKNVSKHNVTPSMVNLLNKSWNCLEKMSTVSIKDKKVSEDRYILLPILANYYSLFKFYYLGNIFGSYRKGAENKEFYKKSKLLIIWLLNIEKVWNDNKQIDFFKSNRLKILPLIQWVIINESMYVIEGEILFKKFKCNSPYVNIYINTRNNFVENRIYNVQLYNGIVNDIRSMSTAYILKKYCDSNINGKITDTYHNDIAKAKGVSIEIFNEERINEFYDKEIDILNSQYNY